MTLFCYFLLLETLNFFGVSVRRWNYWKRRRMYELYWLYLYYWPCRD